MTMRKLLWKEWHEQSWKLGFGCLVLGAMAVIGLQARIIADSEMIQGVGYLGIFLLPILSCCGLLPAERESGSLQTLIALPVSPRKILFSKTAIGILLCVGPMIVAALGSVWMAGGREIHSWEILAFYGEAAATSVPLFIWMMSLTSRLPNEARAAMLAAGVLVFWLLLLPVLPDNPIPATLCPLALTLGAFILNYARAWNAPRAPIMQVGLYFVVTLAVQISVMIVLWLWTAKQFQKTEDRP
jgi:ABC-type Na+ efflux pump permease subunit